MPNTVQFKNLEPDQPTSYLRKGGTRLPGGAIAPISEVMLVGASSPGRWKLAQGAAAAWRDAQDAWIAAGGEPVRVTDAFRDSVLQAGARAKYDAWVGAGKPTPGGAGWTSNMSTAYAAKPGQSNHAWGGAVDIDVGALFHPTTGRGTNATLEMWWKVCAEFGWAPIISQPRASQSEAWHFDHLGPLAKMRESYAAVGERDIYTHVARAGAALAGALPLPRAAADWAYVQARLAICCAPMKGMPGEIDGALGPRTRQALADVGVPEGTTRFGALAVVAALDALGVGLAEVAEL
jgi:hypothetical protein